MPDIARYLPLSHRSGDDETAVTGDWRPHIAAGLVRIADLLDGLTPEQWATPSLCAGWSVRDVAGHLLWRLGPTRRLVRDGLRAVRPGTLTPDRIIDAVSRESATAPTAELVRRLRESAAAYAAGQGRKSVHELTEVVVHGYDLAVPLGLDPSFSPVETGAVAIARAAGGPAATRAIVRARTLTASDDRWSVGRGPTTEAPARSIILVLFGRVTTL
ncbi:maleylpyruvate isomerase family mycothiol-dependent enzyme [Lacisediminihabitans profunda]|uniref:Maleylpyruvate isomerase family mycothiol-dependent enzyme n=1 Tax=Lacisediminihabitans profunda TaxID=2594790 RepID=A0A5C8UT33_9MICO|nr:maleylpyruvate isomerase family mycothiol-dependent enzyme [Lacisediminihabitans profunda]TXN31442.1 maleylpyruvate isomerase family mycothiol-dependent enzyme [Lacisediminihabitans profunda]